MLESMKITVTGKLLYSTQGGRSLSNCSFPPKPSPPRPIIKVGGVARHDIEFVLPATRTRVLSSYTCGRLLCESMGF